MRRFLCTVTMALVTLGGALVWLAHEIRRIEQAEI